MLYGKTLSLFTMIILLVSISLQAEDLIELLSDKAIELADEADIDMLIEEAAGHRLVLLGESTHGTSEYYYWRYVISKKLIENHGYDFIVVEGDWPAFFTVCNEVKGYTDQGSLRRLFKENFNRWPQWMWANEEALTMAEWLQDHNSGLPNSERTGLYGMDVYSLDESIKNLWDYMSSFDKPVFHDKAKLLECFAAFDFDGSKYAQAIHRGHQGCEGEIIRLIEFLKDRSTGLKKQSKRDYFNAKQNALIIRNAERHFRTAVRGGSESWNHRASHFYLTAERLLDYYGEDAKGIVWAHNTHIGDARATTMQRDGSHNIGQLARENLGSENVFLIGFGCYQGEVIAGESWGSTMGIMNMPAAKKDTIENILNRIRYPQYYFIFDSQLKEHQVMSNHIGHRAVGVVYNPAREYPGNYVPTVMAQRYNAFIFIHETTPLNPLSQ